MLFSKWLLNQQHRDDPIGDLARDVVADRNWPSAGNLDSYLDYLADMHAAAIAIDVLEKAWREYVELDAKIRRLRLTPPLSISL